jgi:hypothetical protein
MNRKSLARISQQMCQQKTHDKTLKVFIKQSVDMVCQLYMLFLLIVNIPHLL